MDSITKLHLSSMGDHNFLYMANGDLYGFGMNTTGQLGIINDAENKNKPVFIKKDTTIKMISLGAYHTFFLHKNGDVFVCGTNEYKVLGLDSEEAYICQPTFLMNDPSIKLIVSGAYHNFILKKNGDLLGWGRNSDGQLGNGSTDDLLKPTLIMENTNIKILSCGSHHTYFLKNNGDLFSMGYNSSGQLGTNTHVNSSEPQLVMNDPNILQVICGSDHVFIYKKNGDLLGCGYNINGQLGTNDVDNKQVFTLATNNPKIKMISTGYLHTIFLTEDNEIYMMGNLLTNMHPNSSPGEIKMIMCDPLIKSIFSGYSYSMIYKSNGELLIFGDNEFGQLGLGIELGLKVKQPTLLMKDCYLSILCVGFISNNTWDPNYHQSYPNSFKNAVFTFLLSLKSTIKKRIPKFVLYEILKKINIFDYPDTSPQINLISGPELDALRN